MRGFSSFGNEVDLFSDDFEVDGHHHFFVELHGRFVRAEFLDGVFRERNLLAFDVVPLSLMASANWMELTEPKSFRFRQPWRPA